MHSRTGVSAETDHARGGIDAGMAVAAILAGGGAVYFTKQNLDTANFNDAIGLIRNDTRAFWCGRLGVATSIQDACENLFCSVSMAKHQRAEEEPAAE